MLRDHRTITSVVTSDLCMSCGICQPSCHVDAISIINDPKKGMFIPVIDEDVCDLCDDAKVGRCVVVCPGVEVKFDVLTKKFLDNSKYLNLLGNYEHTYYAHATDDDIRFNSSSGGLVTSLLLFLLEQKIVDGVAVITMNEGLEPKGIIARTPEEIRAAAGSKYCPSHLGDAISEITRIEGRYAVVGLPCHIHGLRKFEKVLPLLQKRIIYHFGLYCANNNTFHATEYFLGENNINPRDVKQLRYRGNGWPGLFSVTTKNGAEVEIRRGTTETDKNRRAAFSSAFHYDFQLPRCFTCNDLTAELIHGTRNLRDWKQLGSPCWSLEMQKGTSS
jgi:coenzyme F420 hydrogenase subunit beta